MQVEFTALLFKNSSTVRQRVVPSLKVLKDVEEQKV